MIKWKGTVTVPIKALLWDFLAMTEENQEKCQSG
jgi:hypothetical protein